MKTLKILVSIILSLFAGLTLFLTLSILFHVFGIAEKQGNYVPAIIWVNLICALLYLYAGHHLWHSIKKGSWALLIAAFLLLLSFIWFYFIYIPSGGLYEKRTIGALIGRLMATLIFWGLFLFISGKEKKSLKA